MDQEQQHYSWKVLLAFIVTGIVIGFLVTAQFKSSIPATSFLYDELHAQEDLIKSYSDDQAVLQTKILNVRKEIEAKQKQSNQAIQKDNLETLSHLKAQIGLDTAKGDGIEITLDDGFFSKRDTSTDALDQSLVHAADLRDIVNILFSADAQAVAINDQRVIASTPISSVGNTILVNNFHVLPPFTITAIGDADVILQRLSEPKVLIDLHKRIKNQKIQWSFKDKKNLIIPVYSGDFRLKYTQPKAS